MLQAAHEEGCDYDYECYYSTIGVTGNNNTQDRVDKAFDSLNKYFKNIKKCTNPIGTGFVLGQCSDYTYNHNYDGSGTEQSFYYNIVTSDGMYISYTANGGWTVVDVNGSKKPNREGRDIFTFADYR